MTRWLITGASGQLGSHVVRLLAQRGDSPSVLALSGRQDVGTAGVGTARVDLADLELLGRTVREFKPTHIVHLGAMTAVADCHAQPAAAERINVEATRVLAQTAREAGAQLVFSSTDMVFDGQGAPYSEADLPRPLSTYGRTKAAAERALADSDNVLVVRIPLMYGLPCNARPTTFAQQVAALRAGEPLRLFIDEWRTPVWIVDAASALIGLAESGVSGLLHIAGPQRLSRYDLIAACARLLEIRNPNLLQVSRNEIAAAESRPEDLSLTADRFEEWFPDLQPGPLHAGVFSPA